KELRKVEKSVSKDIEELLFKVTDKAQQELNADIFNIWRQLETKHYDTWKKVKNDWEGGENYFSKADVDIEVNTDIYSTGTTNKTDSGGTFMAACCFFHDPIDWLSICGSILVCVTPYFAYISNNRLQDYGHPPGTR